MLKHENVKNFFSTRWIQKRECSLSINIQVFYSHLHFFFSFHFKAKFRNRYTNMNIKMINNHTSVTHSDYQWYNPKATSQNPFDVDYLYDVTHKIIGMFLKRVWFYAERVCVHVSEMINSQKMLESGCKRLQLGLCGNTLKRALTLGF